MRVFHLVLFAAWSSVLVIGIEKMWRYESTPGVVMLPRVDWPADSHLGHASGQATLVMLAHPHCPCTRASLNELAKIMARNQRPLTVYVLFYKPRNVPVDWEKTALYEKAASIPGVTVLTDAEGVEARAFHATTSGQVFLYDGSGHLQYSGGITFARGHEGDNAGEQTLVTFLARHQAPQTLQQQSPVFGCSLQGTASP